MLLNVGTQGLSIKTISKSNVLVLVSNAVSRENTVSLRETVPSFAMSALLIDRLGCDCTSLRLELEGSTESTSGTYVKTVLSRGSPSMLASVVSNWQEPLESGENSMTWGTAGYLM